MATPLDSSIFGSLFGDEQVAALFTDEAYIRRMVEVEVALARAEASLGVIPAWAAEEIAARADGAKIALGALKKGAARAGVPTIALVQELRRLVGDRAAPYVHWGATSQDIMDTALVLHLRAAVAHFEERIASLSGRLADLARRHRGTILAARTHSQQALPMSFGLKAAQWLSPLTRHRVRLRQMRPRLLVIQFGGAAGTLAALGDNGVAVMEGLARFLGLEKPAAPWHAQRDGLAEFAGWLSLVTGSLGKMAQDIILLAQTEVGEVVESAEGGRGASSTMPQKQNPVSSELILAAARANASLLSGMHHAIVQEHERATHGWQVEWLALPQMVVLTSGALKHALFLAENLAANEARMRENMRRAGDTVLAEAVAFALSRVMPRQEAHQLVEKASVRALTEGKQLVDVARDMVQGAIEDGEVDWAKLADPAHYLGESETLIDRILAEAEKADTQKL